MLTLNNFMKLALFLSQTIDKETETGREVMATSPRLHGQQLAELR